MATLIVVVVALVASGLTLVSGFGLGTLLLPAFALVFPVTLAVSATAIVHLANNLFKLLLIGGRARPSVVLRFGLPALAGAFLGAAVLSRLAGLPPLAVYEWFGRQAQVTPVKLAVGLLVFGFAVSDWRRADTESGFDPRWMPLGGLLSGFFGGLSGHQGALRSAFLIRAGLSKEAFVGTGVACAVLVDVGRLAVYGLTFIAADVASLGAAGGWRLVTAATVAAFAGALLGVRLLGKMTWSAVHRIVGVLLALVGAGLAAGWI